ncbi:glycosyltransferase [bacterium]|nr:glycosyltransferase [bacterium]
MKKVLIISYYFPPAGGAGVFRTLKFTCYLPEFGWQPTVLSTELPHYFWQDDALVNEIPPDVNVLRTEYRNPLSWFLKNKKTAGGRSHYPGSDFLFLPDNKLWWQPEAYKKGFEILENKHYDLIFATVPPFTGGLIASRLSKRFKIPMIIDFRDSWHNSPARPRLPYFHYKWNIYLEKRVLQQSAAVISVNKSIIQDILGVYPGLSATQWIPNGFDPADIPANLPTRNQELLTIKYLGTVYEGFRYPQSILLAIKEMHEESGMIPIQLEFIGRIPESFQKLVHQYQLGELVKCRGFVSHYEAIGEAMASDLLLLYIQSSSVQQTTSKLYEYLGLGKPVLGLVPCFGEAGRLIREHRAGWVISPDDVQGIKSLLRELLQLKVKGAIFKGEQRPEFLRKNLTRELAQIFDQAVKPECQ